MGWQTNVITQLEFNRETYNSPYVVLDEIRGKEKVIQNITEELSVMVTARPEDLLLHNEDMDLLGLQRTVKDKLEVLEECFIEKYKLEWLRENFDLRDGDFIENPDRKEAVKKWLIDNYILEENDFNNSNNTSNISINGNNNTVNTNQINNIEPVDINAIEGD